MLPIGLRRRLKLDRKKHSILLVEERPDGIFLHPAVTVPEGHSRQHDQKVGEG